MTVTSEKYVITHVADGATQSFIYDFLILANDQILVYEDGNLTVEAYTVTGAGNPVGGTVDFTTYVPAAGIKITLHRDTPKTQEVNYQPYDPFPAETHEKALDKLTLIAQESTTAEERSILLRIGQENVSRLMPVAEPSQIVGWDVAAEALRNYPNPQTGVPYRLPVNFLTNSEFSVMSNADGVYAHGITQISNPEFSVDISGWTNFNSPLSRVDSTIEPGVLSTGLDKWCLKAVDNGSSAAAIYTAATIKGQVYMLEFDYYQPSANVGTEFYVYVYSGSYPGGTLVYQEGPYILQDQWASISFPFVAPASTSYLVFATPVQTGDILYLDAVNLRGAGPGRETTGTVNIPDNWRKTSALKVYRDPTEVVAGTRYSCKIISGGNPNDRIWWPAERDEEWEHVARFAGKRVTIGMAVKTDTANHFNIRLDTGGVIFESPFHTGSGNWEYIKFTVDVPSNATKFQVRLNQAQIDTTCWIAGAMGIKGDDLPDWTYEAIPNEIVELDGETRLVLSIGTLSSGAYFDIQELSNYRLPKNTRSVYGSFYGNCGSAGNNATWRRDASGSIVESLVHFAQVAGINVSSYMLGSINTDGTFYLAPGGSTWSGVYLSMNAVRLW